MIILFNTNIKLLYKYYNNEKLLTKKEKATIINILDDYLLPLINLSETEPDDEIKIIYKEMAGTNFDDEKKKPLTA